MKYSLGLLISIFLFSQQLAADEYRYHLTLSLYKGGDRVPSFEITDRKGVKQVGAGTGLAWALGVERSLNDELAISLSLNNILNFSSIYLGPPEDPSTAWGTRHLALTALYRHAQLRYGLGLIYHFDTSVVVADINSEQKWTYDAGLGYQILLEYLTEDDNGYVLSYNKVEHTANSLPAVDGTSLGLSYRWYF